MATSSGRRRSSRIRADDRFRVSMEELKELMEFRGAEAAKQLQDAYGGAEKLCATLGTSPSEGMTFICRVAYVGPFSVIDPTKPVS